MGQWRTEIVLKRGCYINKFIEKWRYFGNMFLHVFYGEFTLFLDTVSITNILPSGEPFGATSGPFYWLLCVIY